MTETTKYQERLPDLPKALFWDIPGQVPDCKNHPEWVIKRVFDRRSMEDIAEIIIFYGEEKVKEVLTTSLHLDEDISFILLPQYLKRP